MGEAGIVTLRTAWGSKCTGAPVLVDGDRSQQAQRALAGGTARTGQHDGRQPLPAPVPICLVVKCLKRGERGGMSVAQESTSHGHVWGVNGSDAQAKLLGTIWLQHRGYGAV